jgi:hypothetical protein
VKTKSEALPMAGESRPSGSANVGGGQASTFAPHHNPATAQSARKLSTTHPIFKRWRGLRITKTNSCDSKHTQQLLYAFRMPAQRLETLQQVEDDHALDIIDVIEMRTPPPSAHRKS